jgi:hypothetical protein
MGVTLTYSNIFPPPCARSRSSAERISAASNNWPEAKCMFRRTTLSFVL